jgi:hypothetical protein
MAVAPLPRVTRNIARDRASSKRVRRLFAPFLAFARTIEGSAAVVCIPVNGETLRLLLAFPRAKNRRADFRVARSQSAA